MELGSALVEAIGGILGAGGGGEVEGIEEAGDKEVISTISTEGERGGLADDCELGEGESSGTGGGGRTKWKVREAI